MVFTLQLPSPLPEQGWKVKIQDKERLEPPHVTIRRHTRVWRIGLRDGRFLDRDPSPNGVPKEVLAAISAQWETLRLEWDIRNPANPIRTSEDDE